jgi:membrane-bound lytic murein transglycosylase MltF
MKIKKILNQKSFVFWCCITIIMATPFLAYGISDLNVDSKITGNQVWLGDYDQIVEHRFIRVLVPQSKTFYFLDGPVPRGLTYETLKEFEKTINKELGNEVLKLNVLIIPTSRDKLIPALKKGLGDIAAGNLTITDKRLKQIDFCDPLLKGVNEVLVSGPAAPVVKTIDDLSGLTIHVRKSSSYYESLVHLNKSFAAKKTAKIKIVEASEYLEDEDLLEMVNAGVIPMIIIDSHKGKFWAQFFDKISIHTDIKVRQNSKIAWAIRKNSPQLKNVINSFVKKNKKGTHYGNVIFNKYLKNTKYIKNHYKGEDRKRLEAAAVFLKKYGKQYNFDWLMLAALAYQESTIDQSKKSHVGAIGVMQILPSTAKDKNVNIQNIKKIESNIHAGTKYLRFILDRYFNDPEIDALNRVLLTFASYNAGPSKILKLREKTEAMGLDPNIWFRNVEIVAARQIGRETVQYVSNIFKYYIAYQLILETAK